MTAGAPGHPELNDEPIDGPLAALVDAILDGTDVDWSACSDGVNGFEEELRIVAAVAEVHRSIDNLSQDTLHIFPPHLPWQAGHLTLNASLGKGAYGEVFRAWDTQLHRDVAVKLLFRDSGTPDAASTFLDEGRLLARVRHPHVVTVFGAERIDGRVGLVTEFIDGRSLAAVVAAEGRLPVDKVVAIGIDLCRALAAVHHAGLLHRDIKAQNVMQEPGGRVVLMDFGAGALAADAPGNGLAGTPLYVAPELWDGGNGSRRSDIYSLGVLLYFLATGAFPVSGRTAREIREALQRGDRRPLGQQAPGLPREFAVAVERAIALPPAERYAEARELEHALQRSISWKKRVVLWRAGLAAAVLLMALTAFALVAVGRVLYTDSSPVPPAAPQAAGPAAAGPLTALPGLSADEPAPTVPALVMVDVASDQVGRVTVPNYVALGTPSRDGRYLPYVATEKAEAWLVELATGRAERLFERAVRSPLIEALALSSDAGRLAYVARSPQWSELRLRQLERTWPRTAVADTPLPELVVHNEAGRASIVPVEWTRDSSVLLYWVLKQDGAARLSIFRLANNETVVLRTFIGARPRRASLSPDGQFVVYDMPAELPLVQRDLLIAPTVADGTPHVLVGGKSNDALPIWMPDGDGVFFTSNRAGRTEGWTVPVAGGRASGEPVRIAGGLANVAPVAITDDGAFYYTLQTSVPDLYSVPFDRDGKSSGVPRPLRPEFESARTGGAWSRDGRFLSYTVERGMTDLDRGGSFIRIQDVTTGAVREIAPALNYFGGSTRWSPDGRQLLLRARGFDNLWGLYRVDVQSGETHRVTGSTEQNVQQEGRAFEWPTQNTIVYVHMTRGLIEHDLRTGEDRLIVPASGGMINGFGFSPDGSSLAFSTDTGPGEGRLSTLNVRSADGIARVIQSITDGGLCVFQAWSPDGEHLNFVRRRLNELPGLWRIAVSGGTPVDLQVTLDAPTAMYFPALRPDGRELLYGVRRAGFELWRMSGLTVER